MPLYFSEHEVVLPGQLLSDDGKRGGEGTYVVGGKVYAAQVGLAVIKDSKVHVIAFKGAYKPQPGDRVIGVISDVKPNGFEVVLGKHLTGVMRIPDRKEVQSMRLKVGDVVSLRVKESSLRGVILEHGERVKKFEKGLLISMHPAKVSRLIGRRGSMISMIKKITGCNIVVGRNGLIVISGPSPSREFAAISAIKLVESEAHTQGLTERVEKLIKSLLGGGKSEQA